MRRDSVSARTVSMEQPVLVVQEPGLAPQDHPVTIGKPLTIGSDPASGVVLLAPGVAPLHAVVQSVSGQILLEDQQTPGGTRVNGQPVASFTLGPDDVIDIGGITLRLVDRAVTPREDAGPAAASGTGKLIRLGLAGLVTAGVMVFILRLLAPAPPADTSVGSGAARSSAAPEASRAGPSPATPVQSLASGAPDVPVKVASDSALARQVVANAVTSGVDPVDALYDEGESQLSAGRLLDAARLFAAVLQRRPSHQLARLRLAEAQDRLDDSIEQAMAEAERSSAQLRYDDAVAMWERVLELVEPGDTRAATARTGISDARRHMRH